MFASIIALFSVSTALAQQPGELHREIRGDLRSDLQMTREVTDQQLQFTYQFRDIEGDSQMLQFTIPRQGLLRTPLVFRPLSQPRLLREMASLQRDYAQQQGWRDARLTSSNGRLNYELLRGEQENRLRQWQRAEQDALEQVLQRYYYQEFRPHAGRRGYTPDHPRIANESSALLQPVSEALAQRMREQYGNYSPRQALAYVTQFIQQIPYDDFTDRLSSPGAGFVAPGRLLYENRGDCDSKVTLLAALMANLLPDTERRIVYLPSHAVFALNIEAEENDLFVRDGELEFVVADPTGPAQLPVGEVARAYQSHIRSGALTMLAI